MKKWILITALISAIISSNIAGFLVMENTKEEMILTAKPDFEAHTIEWNGEVHLYD